MTKVSHAWRYRFLDVFDALTHHFEKDAAAAAAGGGTAKTHFLWFDLFSNNQHNTMVCCYCVVFCIIILKFASLSPSSFLLFFPIPRSSEAER
jgi:hypothetical protein